MIFYAPVEGTRIEISHQAHILKNAEANNYCKSPDEAGHIKKPIICSLKLFVHIIIPGSQVSDTGPSWSPFFGKHIVWGILF